MRPPSRGLAGSVMAVALLLGAPALASAQTTVDCSTVQDPAQYSECMHHRHGDLHTQHQNEHAQQHNMHQGEHARHHNEHQGEHSRHHNEHHHGDH